MRQLAIKSRVKHCQHCPLFAELSATLAATRHPAHCRALHINKKPREWRDNFRSLYDVIVPFWTPLKATIYYCMYMPRKRKRLKTRFFQHENRANHAHPPVACDRVFYINKITRFSRAHFACFIEVKRCREKPQKPSIYYVYAGSRVCARMHFWENAAKKLPLARHCPRHGRDFQDDNVAPSL